MSSIQVAEALRAIAAQHDGKLTPEIVVKAAKSASSPLHNYFTWDDKRAAQEHRLNEARTLIRSVKVDVVTTHYTLKAPEFVRDPSAENAQGYASLGRLRSDADLAREAVVAEFARASSALARAKAIAAALGLSDEIEELHGRVDAFARRLQHQEAGASA